MAKKPTYEELEQMVKEFSDRKQVQEELQSQKNIFESIMGAMTSGLTIRDLDYKLTYQNDVVRDLFGNCIGEKCYRAFEGNDEICDDCPVELALKDGKSHISVRKVEMPSGEIAFLENIANPIRDANGKIISCLEINTNITEQKQSEAGLRKSEEKYHTSHQHLTALMENTDDYILISDRKGLPVMFNSTYSRIMREALGVDIKPGLQPHKLLPDKDAVAWWDNLHRRVLSGEKFREEYRHEFNKGDVRHFEISYHPIIENGEVTGFSELTRDISERKLAEEALRESEEKYRSMMEAMIDPACICSPDFRITYMNPAMEKRIGFNAVGECCYEVINSSNEKCPWCELELVQKGQSVEHEIISPFDNRAFLVSQSPIFHGDGNISIMAIYKDITKNKYLQDQLIHSERMAATGQLAASIAHEINSPLQAVTVLLSTMKEQYNDNNELIENIDLLKGAYTSIRDTVKNLLDLNRPGKEQKQQTNPNNIIKKTVDLIQARLKQNKIKINLDLSSEIPAIHASPQQLNHLFLNLINNSIEALTGASHPKDGRMNRTSDNRRIDIKTKLRNKNIIIEISDNGPGISEKDLLYIFDPFYTTKKEMGLGVGLSICHDIIKDHHGNIVTENSPNEGAVLTITIPFEQSQGNQEKT